MMWLLFEFYLSTDIDNIKTLKNWEPYILNSFDCPYSNGFTDGTNNSIKVLKRVTYDMPNFRNFRARILHCCSKVVH